MIDETEPQLTLSFSMLPKVISELEKRVKTFSETKDPEIAATIINAQLEIINSYGVWCEGLKKEIKKLESLNKSQALMIQNTCKVVSV